MSRESKLFTRGSGPLISVLLPTRGRVEKLCRSLDSLHSLAYDKANLEFVLKVDDDDPDTIQACAKLQSLLGPQQVKVVITPQGEGYQNIHLWLNQLAWASRGDWLLVWNDDARMLTQSWDRLLALADVSGVWHGLDNMVLTVFRTQGRPHNNEFPCLRRGCFELLGHFGLGPHVDNWIYTVMAAVGCAYPTPIVVDHRQEEEDSTNLGHKEQRAITAESFNTLEAVGQRLEDAKKVYQYLMEHSK